EHLLLHRLMKLGDAVLPNLISARRCDLCNGVCISGMEVDLCAVDSEAAEIADEGLKFLDVRIFAKLAELDFQRTIVIHDTAVNLDVETRQPFLRVLNQIESHVQQKLNINPTYTNLLKEEKLIVTDPRIHH